MFARRKRRDSNDVPSEIISQVISQEAKNMEHKLKGCENGGHYVCITDEGVFDPTIKEWLERNVGVYDEAWCWTYQWVPAEIHTRDTIVLNNQRCCVSIIFREEKHAFLFSLRWSEVCMQEKNA